MPRAFQELSSSPKQMLSKQTTSNGISQIPVFLINSKIYCVANSHSRLKTSFDGVACGWLHDTFKSAVCCCSVDRRTSFSEN